METHRPPSSTWVAYPRNSQTAQFLKEAKAEYAKLQ
jgi:hypothetical protein